MTGRPPLLSVALLSATLLAYEISLMHLFAIIQYHHFAYMIISLALLGYGSSGTFLAIFQDRLKNRYAAVYLTCTVLFSGTTLISFLLAQAVPFNGLELFWDIRQTFFLALLFLLLILPFFFGASALGMTLAVYRKSVGAVYGADLVGAGIGSLAIIVILGLVFPRNILLVVCGSGFTAATIAVWELAVARPVMKTFGLLGLFALLVGVGHKYELKVTPYKPLEQYLRIAGTKIVAERSSPLGLVQVLESPTIPLRYAPGMSLVSGQEPLEQKGVFINGEGFSVITRRAETRDQLAYLDQMTSALPYHLNKPDNVLVLGIGGGQDILQARYHGIKSITGVELNPQLVELLGGQYADYAGQLLRGETQVHIGDMRGFMEKNQVPFDLIQLALVDSFLPSASGLYALRENYLYTVEALREYLQNLSPHGYLAITRWLQNPPRDGLKLLATAVAALKQADVADVGRHLALIRGWQTSTLLIKRGQFSHEEIRRIETFCRTRAFDIVYTFATGEELANRHNLLADPLFSQAARALIGGDSADFIARYKYNLEPATDDRPYFHHFFKWSAIREILQLRASGGAALLESGYLILLTVLAVAGLLSLLLILAPLFLLRRSLPRGSGSIARHKVFLYFFSTGIAFLLIEIAFIQKCMLFLHHPVYAISTVIAAFLVFGGLGSLIAQRWTAHPTPEKLVRRVVAGIAAICLCYLLFLSTFFSLAGDLPFSGRLFFTAILIAPPAILMGMPFPLALSRLANQAVELVPWAWGINGCGSVISSMVATLLAIHFGFSVVIVVAVLLYLVVACTFPGAGKVVREG